MKTTLKSIVFSLLLPLLPLSAAEPAPLEPIVLLGGGVGSLTSAIYLGRAGLSPLVIEGPMPGGLLTQSHTVQNWPGVLEIDGTLLTDKIREQAAANGARFLNGEVVEVDFSKRPYTIMTRALDGSGKTGRIQAESVIIAMGTKSNFLGIPGEQTYWGRGVTNCAICDGALYKDKIVGVVGGGDAAVLEALYLSNIAKEVHVFIRKDSLRAIEERRVAILLEQENVKLHYNTTVQAVNGDGKNVTGIRIKNGKKESTFALDGLFLAIGSTPNSKLFEKFLELDDKGYISLKKDQQTSLEGIYAVGDIVDPVYKQAISAAGDGAKAALQAQHYLSDKQNRLAVKDFAKKIELAPIQHEVVEVSSVEQFNSILKDSEIPVIIDFYATWCPPCKRVSPILDSSANVLAGRVKFLKVNVDNFLELSTLYNVKAMPTVLLLDSSGVELERKVGLDQISALLKQLQAQ